MQPKDSAEKTPENNIRMKKKLDKMIKDLAPQYPLCKSPVRRMNNQFLFVVETFCNLACGHPSFHCEVPDVSPYIIDQENGIVYSPSLKRSDSMARRLKEMREKRDSPSPTGRLSVVPSRTTPKYWVPPHQRLLSTTLPAT